MRSSGLRRRDLRDATRLTIAGILASAACAEPVAQPADLDRAPDATIIREIRFGTDTDALNTAGRLRVSPRNEVIVSQPSAELLVFDSTGTLVRRIGRRGAGPGEYQALGAFGFLGDTLWIDDRIARRTTLLDLDDSVIATIPYAPFDSSALAAILPSRLRDATAEYRYRATVAFAPGGVSITYPSVSLAGLDKAGVAERPLFTVARDGRPVRVLATVPEPIVKYMSGTGSARRPVVGSSALDDGPRWAVSASGNRIAIVTPDWADNTLRILQLSPSGDTLIDRRVSFTPRALPSDFAEKAAKDLAEQTGRPDDAGAIQDALRLPKAYPPVIGVLVEDGGVVWLWEYPHDLQQRWIAVDPQGNVVSAIAMNYLQRPLLIDGDRLWISEKDSDGVESIYRFRIEPPAQGREPSDGVATAGVLR